MWRGVFYGSGGKSRAVPETPERKGGARGPRAAGNTRAKGRGEGGEHCRKYPRDAGNTRAQGRGVETQALPEVPESCRKHPSEGVGRKEPSSAGNTRAQGRGVEIRALPEVTERCRKHPIVSECGGPEELSGAGPFCAPKIPLGGKERPPKAPGGKGGTPKSSRGRRRDPQKLPGGKEGPPIPRDPFPETLDGEKGRGNLAPRYEYANMERLLC